MALQLKRLKYLSVDKFCLFSSLSVLVLGTGEAELESLIEKNKGGL